MSPDHDGIRIELRQELDAFVPDRASIAERADVRRRAAARRSRFRPVAAAAGVAVVVALAGLVAGRSNDNRAPAPAPVPIAAAPTTVAPSPARPPSAPVRDIWLSAAGSVDKNSGATWTQATVTVHNRTPAAHLVTTITVARTFDAHRAGLYTTAPNSDIRMSVTETPTTLIYRFELKAGTSLAPGTWVFAAQFDHRSGRRRDADSYTVDARSGTRAGSDSGGFTEN